MPETVLERALGPISRGVLALAGVARRLQHGRLQFYIVYIAGGVLLLALLTWIGGSQ